MSFLGTHPTLTQVPPTAEKFGGPCWSWPSIKATLAPCPLAIREARTPPDPPPITTKSYTVVSSSSVVPVEGAAAVVVESAMFKMVVAKGRRKEERAATRGVKEEEEATKVKIEVNGTASFIVSPVTTTIRGVCVFCVKRRTVSG